MQVIQSHPFRVTRDAEVSIQELEAEDLLETIEKGVRQRRFGRVVRLTVDTEMPAAIRDILTENLELDARDVYTMEPPLGMSDIEQLHGLERPELKYPPFVPATPARTWRTGKATSLPRSAARTSSSTIPTIHSIRSLISSTRPHGIPRCSPSSRPSTGSARTLLL